MILEPHFSPDVDAALEGPAGVLYHAAPLPSAVHEAEDTEE